MLESRVGNQRREGKKGELIKPTRYTGYGESVTTRPTISGPALQTVGMGLSEELFRPQSSAPTTGEQAYIDRLEYEIKMLEQEMKKPDPLKQRPYESEYRPGGPSTPHDPYPARPIQGGFLLPPQRAATQPPEYQGATSAYLDGAIPISITGFVGSGASMMVRLMPSTQPITLIFPYGTMEADLPYDFRTAHNAPFTPDVADKLVQMIQTIDDGGGSLDYGIYGQVGTQKVLDDLRYMNPGINHSGFGGGIFDDYEGNTDPSWLQQYLIDREATDPKSYMGDRYGTASRGYEQGGNGQGGTTSRRVVRRVVRRGGEVISDEAFPSGRRVVRRGGAKKTRKRGGSKRKKKRKTKY